MQLPAGAVRDAEGAQHVQLPSAQSKTPGRAVCAAALGAVKSLASAVKSLRLSAVKPFSRT